MSRVRSQLLTAIPFLIVVTQVAADPPVARIDLEPMWPQLIADNHLPGVDTTNTASGFANVGAGTMVYMSAGGTIDKGRREDPLTKQEITEASWSLLEVPAGSAATLTPGPFDGWHTLKTDRVGAYIVQLVVTNAQGEASQPVTQRITAGNYVGVGTISGAKPDAGKGQCGACHPDKAEGWATTRHATKFQRDIDGGVTSYSNSCIRCHTVGFNLLAENGGFDDVQAQTGWVVPDTLREGNFAAMPPELQNLANIQCENCHGPGSEHKGNKANIARGFEFTNCAQCHGATRHPRGLQIQRAGHNRSLGAYAGVTAGVGDVSNPLNGCGIQCHSAEGFVEFQIEGKPIKRDLFAGRVDEAAPVSCPTCHDPHLATNDRQLRVYGEVTLPGTNVTIDAGRGAVCFKCHTNYTPGYEAIIATTTEQGGKPYHNQGPMFAGVGGYEYPGKTYRNAAHFYMEDKCVQCHMKELERSDPGYLLIGNHTWNMADDGDTPDDSSDDMHNTAGCEPCHGPVEDFNINGTQDRVQRLMDQLASLLPVDAQGRPVLHSTDAVSVTQAQTYAAWNWHFVDRDHTRGIHNHTYAEQLLVDAIESLGGSVITAVAEDGAARPEAYALEQNAPNPFNPSTAIRYELPQAGMVQLTVYNALGQKVVDLVNAFREAGQQTALWNGRDESGRQVVSGVYVYRLAAGDFVASKRMILLR